MTAPITKNALMKVYNAARNARTFDAGRLNRALGLAQRKVTHLVPQRNGEIIIDMPASEDGNFYLLRSNGAHNIGACTCMDFKRGTQWCKHRIAGALLVRAASTKVETI